MHFRKRGLGFLLRKRMERRFQPIITSNNAERIEKLDIRGLNCVDDWHWVQTIHGYCLRLGQPRTPQKKLTLEFVINKTDEDWL